MKATVLASRESRVPVTEVVLAMWVTGALLFKEMNNEQ